MRTIAVPRPAPKVAACGKCQVSCQSACKTSCTVGNQVCARA
ncbi:MAG TPA: six-cysteine peptide SCIFF [Clostridiales bacterium UBA8153]|nr:six-cysteine peptide SCIFF [Clostridiales bacterium UBA8153]